jgi:hypothetical protein
MTISRIWQAFGLQPHRTDSFKLSPDPLLIGKVATLWARGSSLNGIVQESAPATA